MRNTAIFRNSKDYFLKNIQSNDEFIDSLFYLNCITAEQRYFIQRQRSKRDKNAELLKITRSFDDKKLSTIAKCLRQTNQTEVARVIEKGGVVIKVKARNCGTKFTESVDAKLLHQTIEDLRNRAKPMSYQTDKLINQLKDEGIEILSSQLDRQIVVVWIWCRSQAALEYMQKLYESNQLRDVFENIQPSTSKLINIDRNQFKKTVVVCSISFILTHRIIAGENEFMRGVTILRNEIYILCRADSYDPNVIRVFEDRSPFRLQKEIKIKLAEYPFHIGSSEKENCLYVSDSMCIWKIIRQTRDQHTIIRWLTYGFPLRDHWSVSTDGHILISSFRKPILMIYGSDAKLIRFIQLPRDINGPVRAVETSIGNFIILHELNQQEDEGESGLNGRQRLMNMGISELTRDGQMVIRRFIPSNETQQLRSFTTEFKAGRSEYFLLDSCDRVFVTDIRNGRIILLDSDLKWNRVLCTVKEDSAARYPWRLCYDEEQKQLIVGDFDAVNIYTESQNKLTFRA